ncbi:hypothetical protein BMS3Bbin03_00075 [bacterium BMS3Bbin03]|nr:hypothetical protein BMS3Bbin03_00075 [bacterium BMS3Bbin03]
MMFCLVSNHKKRIFKEKPELGLQLECAWFGFLVFKFHSKKLFLLRKIIIVDNL